MNIPFVDLKAQYKTIKEEVDKAIHNVLDNTAFILGENVERFEKNFAQFCKAKHCIGLNSGTAALHLALLANNIKAGDEVIVPANSFFATAEVVSLTGAKPVFADVHETTYNINAEDARKRITGKTKAIIPVHLYGQPADMDPIIELAEEKDIVVIEDAAQAHDSEYKKKRIPVTTGCFSFYPGKNLGAYGEAGAIVTNDDKVAEKIKLLRAHGESPKHHHHIPGYNYRMEGIQGAVLDVKLKYLKSWTDKRRKNAYLYNELLENADVVTPFELKDARHVYHLYVIRVKNREKVMNFLNKNGIATGMHYPIPIHMQPAYKAMNMKGKLPVTEKVVNEIISLPMFPELTEDQIDYVAQKVKEAVK